MRLRWLCAFQIHFDRWIGNYAVAFYGCWHWHDIILVNCWWRIDIPQIILTLVNDILVVILFRHTFNQFYYLLRYYSFLVVFWEPSLGGVRGNRGIIRFKLLRLLQRDQLVSEHELVVMPFCLLNSLLRLHVVNSSRSSLPNWFRILQLGQFSLLQIIKELALFVVHMIPQKLRIFLQIHTFVL